MIIKRQPRRDLLEPPGNRGDVSPSVFAHSHLDERRHVERFRVAFAEPRLKELAGVLRRDDFVAENARRRVENFARRRDPRVDLRRVDALDLERQRRSEFRRPRVRRRSDQEKRSERQTSER
jgi:hypothetical protein